MPFLYGKAYRATVSIERFSNIPGVIVPNENLDPETIETFDAQVFYYGEDSFSALTYYHSVESDTITVIIDPANLPTTFVNKADKLKYHGLEYEFKWEISDNWFSEGSYTYQTTDLNSNDVRGAKVTPENMLKLGVSYDAGTGVSFGIFDSYFEEYTKCEITPTVINEKNSDYHYLTLNVTFNLNKLLNSNARNQSKVILYGDNLLEDDPVYAPDLVRPEFNTLPMHAGRAVYLHYQLTTN